MPAALSVVGITTSASLVVVLAIAVSEVEYDGTLVVLVVVSKRVVVRVIVL